jgi:hypothetical protein
MQSLGQALRNETRRSCKRSRLLSRMRLRLSCQVRGADHSPTAAECFVQTVSETRINSTRL